MFYAEQSRCKGPEVRARLMDSRNSKEAKVPGEPRASGRESIRTTQQSITGQQEGRGISLECHVKLLEASNQENGIF